MEKRKADSEYFSMEGHPYHTASFIIPTLNESRYIEKCITSIRNFSSSLQSVEIIVVDNGSIDNTISIAKNYGSTVHQKPGSTVGAVRNFGASIAKYDYLIFIDADVLLTDLWRNRIPDVLNQLSSSKPIITGSLCGTSGKHHLIERCWWAQNIDRVGVKYINSGHMIIRRDVFFQLGGFDEKLKTGEDSEFCQRVRDVKVEIRHDPKLRVIHEGYPKTLTEFFRRERWHGLGDYHSLDIFTRSKPAIIATTQAMSLIISAIISFSTSNYYWIMVYIAIMVPICFLAAFRRVSTVGVCLFVNSALYFVYFWARTFSLIDALVGKKISRRR